MPATPRTRSRLASWPYARAATALILVAASLSAVYCVFALTTQATPDSRYSLYDYWRTAHEGPTGHSVAHNRLVHYFWHVAPPLLTSLVVALAAAAFLLWLVVGDWVAERRLLLSARQRAQT